MDGEFSAVRRLVPAGFHGIGLEEPFGFGGQNGSDGVSPFGRQGVGHGRDSMHHPLETKHADPGMSPRLTVGAGAAPGEVRA